MKIKYIIFGDGQSPHLIKWIKELYQYFDLYVVTLQSISSDIYSILTKNKCFELNVPTKQSGNNIRLIFQIIKLKKIFNSINADIIHAHYITSYGFLSAWCKTSHSKLILSAWGTDILKTPDESFVKRKITLFALKRAHLLTSDSIFMTKKILDLYSNASVLTFPFGLKCLPDADLKDKNPNLFFSNRALTENYRIDKVLKLFAEIKKYNRDAMLVIANKGNKEQELKELMNQLNISDSVSFVGYLNEDEQQKYYLMAQYYFSMPESDATSVSLLEAMAYGCVPIVSDIPANREWIVSSENGIIVTDEMNLIGELKTIDILKAFNTNRAIIKEKAIFPDRIKQFVQYVNENLL
ncbi:MAG: glycosyltransferase [Bacteroidales bacterium]|nr:glycosyltransferase [Bacteroidales bacterium]